MSMILTIIILLGTIGSLITIIKKQYIWAVMIASISVGTFIYYSTTDKKTTGNIIVSISPDYAPYAYMENGEVCGIDVDLLHYIGQQLNKKIIFKVVDFTFLTLSLEKGEADIAAGGLSITEERENALWKKNMYFTTSYNYANTGILIQNSLLPSELNKNFKGKIIVQSGSLFVEIAKERFPNCEILLRDDFNIGLEEFKEGKVDGIIGDLLVLVWFKKKYMDNFKIFALKHKLNKKTAKGNAFIINKNKISDLKLDDINRIIIKYKKDKKFLKEIEDIESI